MKKQEHFLYILTFSEIYYFSKKEKNMKKKRETINKKSEKKTKISCKEEEKNIFSNLLEDFQNQLKSGHEPHRTLPNGDRLNTLTSRPS